MKKSTLTGLTVVCAVVAVAAPIVFALVQANEGGREAELERAMSYAEDVRFRSDSTAAQIDAGISVLVALETEVQIYPEAVGPSGPIPDDRCSAASLELMRRIDLSSTYIQAIGAVSGDRIVCSSIAGKREVLELGPVEMITPKGTRVRAGVRFPFAPGATFLVVEHRGYAAIIHKDLPIDTSTHADDVSLATFLTEPLHDLTSRGFVDPDWLKRLDGGREAAFFDNEYVVAVARSDVNFIAAIAAVPAFYAERETIRLAYYLVPIGIVAGIVLAFAVLQLARMQLKLPAIIKSGLRRGEFFLVYQPIIDLRDGRWVGAEALIRWQRPTGEFVRPDIFIEVAEEVGLIERITEHVIELVAADTGRLFAGYPDFHIGINLSPQDFHSGRTVDHLKRLARETGARGANLQVEATERGFMNADVARDVIREIRGLGISVAIDDFGTGYSSLSYLGSFELDYLKVDKSFVDTIGADAATSQVVPHIIEMAKSLNLKIIAEGVETEAQARYLRERNVEFAQGWLFARPMPMSELLEGLAASLRPAAD